MKEQHWLSCVCVSNRDTIIQLARVHYAVVVCTEEQNAMQLFQSRDTDTFWCLTLEEAQFSSELHSSSIFTLPVRLSLAFHCIKHKVSIWCKHNIKFSELIWPVTLLNERTAEAHRHQHCLAKWTVRKVKVETFICYLVSMNLLLCLFCWPNGN